MRRPPRAAPAALAALLGCLALAACLPAQASYDVGLGTQEMTGSLLLAPALPAARVAAPPPASRATGPLPADPALGGALVVALKYHHQFVEQPAGQALLRPSAHVLRPAEDGAWSFTVPADVVEMDVFFIAPDHLTQVFRFRRQLGVGHIRYRAVLLPMPDWRSHFYTYLVPQLEPLISDERYRLGGGEQQVLSQWLLHQGERLAAKAGMPTGGSEGSAPAATAGATPAQGS